MNDERINYESVYKSVVIDKELRKLLNIDCRIKQLFELYEDIKDDYDVTIIFNPSEVVQKEREEHLKDKLLDGYLDLGYFLYKFYMVASDLYITLSFLGFEESAKFYSQDYYDRDRNYTYILCMESEEYRKRAQDIIKEISSIIYKINKLEFYMGDVIDWKFGEDIIDFINQNNFHHLQEETEDLIKKYDKYIKKQLPECKTMSELISDIEKQESDKLLNCD